MNINISQIYRYLSFTIVGISFFFRRYDYDYFSVGFVFFYALFGFLILLNSSFSIKFDRFLILFFFFLSLSILKSLGVKEIYYIVGQFIFIGSIFFISIFFYTTSLKEGERKFFHDIYISIFILIFLNAVFFSSSFGSENLVSPDVYNSFNLVSNNRINLNFSQSGQELSSLAVILIILSLFLPVTCLSGWIRFFGIFFSLLIILGWGSRSSIAFGLMVILLNLLNFKGKKTYYISMLFPALSFSFIFYLYEIFPPNLVTTFDRYGMGMLLSGREIIWLSFLDFYLDFTRLPLHHLVFGYGVFGQVSAGFYESYSYLFNNYSETFSVTIHNTFLQYFVDGGATLLLILNAVFFKTVTNVEINSYSKVFISCFVFLFIISGFEVFFSIYSVFTLMILIVFYGFYTSIKN